MAEAGVAGGTRGEAEEPQDFGGIAGAVVVTGGSGGIGAATCRLLAARGADVALTYRERADAAETVVAEARRRGRDAQAWQVDLTDAAAALAFGEAARDRFGAVHGVVHAAGPQVPQMYLGSVAPGKLREHLDGEVTAFFNVVQPLLGHLREQQGAIVAVTTAATRRHAPRDGLSAGTKGAVEALVRALAVEEGRYGVRANCVGPGMLADGMAERLVRSGDLDERALAAARSNIPLRRFGRAHDVAEAVCFLLSPRAGYVSGQKLDVDGGYGA